MNTLVCTLGASWPVVPESWGLFPGNSFELYANHPGFIDIEILRRRHGLPRIDQVWALTTGGARAAESVRNLTAWSHLTGVEVRIWAAPGTDGLISEAECRSMTELVFRAVLAAREQSEGLFLSLAGGRKTMSADMQRAAGLFGCDGIFHVVDTKPLPTHLREPIPDLIARPLAVGDAGHFQPVYVGRELGHEALKVAMDDFKPLVGRDYPLPEPWAGQEFTVGALFGEPFLEREVAGRVRQSGRVMANFSNYLLKRDRAGNFLALYRLPPQTIEAWQKYRMGLDPGREAEELKLLSRLPKTELHCHLGGVADVPGLVALARANAPALKAHAAVLEPWLARLRPMVAGRDLRALRAEVPTVKKLRTMIEGLPEPLAVAAFIALFKDDPGLLDAFVFGDFVREEAFVGIGIEAYEALGDLQGSGLLQSEASIREACRILVRSCREHMVRYLELRCSPEKYTRAGLSSLRVVDIITEEMDREPGLRFGLVFIASRHGDDVELDRHVNLATELLARGRTELVGFDLAGNEAAAKAEEFRDAFRPLMEHCLRLTIHAGETMDARSIWQAVYSLNADRIGHGLSLGEHQELMKKIRDRRVALEMCPSSNMQIVGFQDNYLSTRPSLKEYPLKSYLHKGLRVTVNTDNPGISRTNPTRELHRACCLTPGGLSLWEVLSIIRAGFRSAFCRDDDRRALLLEAEREILSALDPSSLENP